MLLKPEHANRNITYTLASEPVVVHPKYKLFEWPFYKVFPSELGLTTYADIHFRENPNGPYELENIRKLDAWGILYKDFWYFTQKKC